MRSDILSVEGVASMQADLHMAAAATDRIAGATDRIATTVVSLPTLVESERRIVLNELSRQRAIVLAAFTLEREAATETMIQAFAAERSELPPRDDPGDGRAA